MSVSRESLGAIEMSRVAATVVSSKSGDTVVSEFESYYPVQPVSRVWQPDCQLKTSRHRPELLCIASSDQSIDQNRRGRLSAMRWECGASGKRATSVCRPAIVLIPECFRSFLLHAKIKKGFP